MLVILLLTLMNLELHCKILRLLITNYKNYNSAKWTKIWKIREIWSSLLHVSNYFQSYLKNPWAYPFQNQRNTHLEHVKNNLMKYELGRMALPYSYQTSWSTGRLHVGSFQCYTFFMDFSNWLMLFQIFFS